jgi:hypothetical protein
MPSRRAIPPIAEPEVNQYCEQGLTAHQIRLRLELRGISASERAINRYAAARRADQRRLRELWAIGAGVGSVHANFGAIADVIRTSAPGWRETQAAVLRDLFTEFLRRPTAEGFTGVVVGAHALLVSASLNDFFGVKDA